MKRPPATASAAFGNNPQSGPAAGFGGGSVRFGFPDASGQKDAAAFGALGGLGVAGQNAMGQLGASRNNALANQSVAAANAYGQMANSYYNTMGQLGNIAGGLSAAGLNSANNSLQFNQGGSFNFGGGGGGFGGFNTSGPEGTIASGSMMPGGGGSGGGSSFNASLTRGGSAGERQGFVDQGYGFLGGLRGDLNNPNNQAMALAGLMGNEFAANRQAVMDPSIMNSLSGQLAAGHRAIGDLYGMSNYGFNTLHSGPQTRFVPQGATPWANRAGGSWF